MLCFFPAQKLENTHTKTVTMLCPSACLSTVVSPKIPVIVSKSRSSAWDLPSNVAAVHFSSAKNKNKLPASSWIFWVNLQQAQHKKRVRGAGCWFLKVSKLMSLSPGTREARIRPERDGSLHKFATLNLYYVWCLMMMMMMTTTTTTRRRRRRTRSSTMRKKRMRRQTILANWSDWVPNDASCAHTSTTQTSKANLAALTWIDCSHFQSKQFAKEWRFLDNSMWHFIESLVTNFGHELFTTFDCAVCCDTLWSAVSKPPAVSATNIAGGTRAWPVTVQNASEIPSLQFLRKGKKKDEYNFNSTTPWGFISWRHFLNWKSETGKLQAPVSPGADVSMVRLKVTKLTLSATGCKGQETVNTGGGGTSAINFHHIISYHIISCGIVWYCIVSYQLYQMKRWPSNVFHTNSLTQIIGGIETG